MHALAVCTVQFAEFRTTQNRFNPADTKVSNARKFEIRSKANIQETLLIQTISLNDKTY